MLPTPPISFQYFEEIDGIPGFNIAQDYTTGKIIYLKTNQRGLKKFLLFVDGKFKVR